MICDDCRPLLDAYVDGELDVRGCLEVEAHLASCNACSARRNALRELSQSVRVHASRFAPSATLERKLRGLALPTTQVWQAVGAPIEVASAAGIRWRNVVVALSCAAAITVVWFAALRFARPDTEHALAEEVVAAHVRSLLVDHLTDVASSDRHTVKPWFQGKIPFAVDTRDFAAQGFALEGGRLDYIDGRTVAAIVYRHGPHALNVFAWSGGDASDAPLRTLTERGFHVDHECRGGIQRWIVSDADESTVARLVQLLDTRD